MMLGKPEDYLKAARSRRLGASGAEPCMRPYRTGRAGTPGGGSAWRAIRASVVLLPLLLLPCCALSRLACSLDWRLLAGATFAVSWFTYMLYRADKRSAAAGEWRVSEATLHLAEIAGGWPGGFLAQRILRHKTRKMEYLFVFWAIVLLHQGLAIDYLNGLPVSRTALRFVRVQATHLRHL